jgi:hypothetical protein
LVRGVGWLPLIQWLRSTEKLSHGWRLVLVFGKRSGFVSGQLSKELGAALAGCD